MERILVVDDEDKIRAIIRKYGEFEGYEIAEAHDGMEAVEICRKEDFDLIILDVMMPELDGFPPAGKSASSKRSLSLCSRHAARSMTRSMDLNSESTIMW